MLANLSAEVRECLWHAKDCAERAKMEPNPSNPARLYGDGKTLVEVGPQLSVI